MPLSTEVVGRTGAPVAHAIDARWTMAYAGALGDLAPGYLDTRARPDVLAHPLFPVCFEWPVFLDPRCLPTGLPGAERLRGVHASHDLTLHRPVRAGLALTTRATLARVEARRSGAFLLTRLDTTAGDGEPICTTWYGTLFRGVAVVGGDRALPDAGPALAPAPEVAGAEEHAIDVAANAALVYSECARIWNPIHTDPAVAAAAGLPEPILHGTATLALAVSRVVATCLTGDAERVARVAGRFGAMVRMPARLTLRLLEVAADAVRFEVREPGGGLAIRDGLLAVRS